MALFPSFKLSQLLQKSSLRSKICEDLPRFKCGELSVKQRIGQGSFESSEYKGSEDTKCQKLLNIFETGLKTYAVIVEKSLSEKKIWKKSWGKCMCCRKYAKLTTV